MPPGGRTSFPGLLALGLLTLFVPTYWNVYRSGASVGRSSEPGGPDVRFLAACPPRRSLILLAAALLPLAACDDPAGSPAAPSAQVTDTVEASASARPDHAGPPWDAPGQQVPLEAGLEPGVDFAAVRGALAEAGVPSRMYSLTPARPTKPATQFIIASFRPIVGGVKIDIAGLNVAGTHGFNVRHWDIGRGFVTAAHVVLPAGQTDGLRVEQVDDTAGTETLDPRDTAVPTHDLYPDDTALLCQYAAMENPTRSSSFGEAGDSGAPVFGLEGTGSELFGLLWAASDSSITFSPIGGVRTDLDPNTSLSCDGLETLAGGGCSEGGGDGGQFQECTGDRESFQCEANGGW